MPYETVKKDTGQVFPLRPIGSGGVDLFTDPASLDPGVLSRCENVELTRGTADRRKGAKKIANFTIPAKSHTFGTDAKYATFTPPLIPLGGWAAAWHFIATRPSSGKTAFIMGSRPSGQTFHVLKVTLSDAGVITVAWTDSGGNARSVACTAVSDGAEVHLFAAYDPIVGTFTVYVNGVSSGTPLTGLAATLKPDQTTGVVWTFGVHKQTGSAVTADTHFDGRLDGMTLWTLRGQQPATTQNSTSVIETLRRHSTRAWPNPDMASVLAHYDMDEASGTSMFDRSAQKNHGTYVGTPSVTNPVAYQSAVTNLVTRIEEPAGRFNIVASFGNLFFEKTREAAV